MGAESSLFHYKSFRLVVLLLLCFATYATISMRSNLGIAIICMVDSTNETTYDRDLSLASEQCSLQTKEQQRSSGYHGEFKWTKSEQALLFSLLFYGSITTITVSGALSDKYGPKNLLLASAIVYTILTLLTPWFVYNYHVYLVVRFLMGMCDGMFFPCAASLCARWFPPDERSTVASIYTSGNQLAASFGVIMAGSLCEIPILNGWPLIFYSVGEKEKLFLNVQLSSQHSGLGQKKLSFKKIPWFSMLTSTATLAVVISQFSFNFINTFLQFFLPAYFKDILQLDISQLIFKNVMAIGADSLKKANVVSSTAACKILQSIATFGTSAILVLMAYFVVDCTHQQLGIILSAVLGCFFAGQISGAFTAALSIAPSFTGTISSVTTFAGVIGSILAPSLVGFFNKTGALEEWRINFLISAGISAVSGLIFLIFGSAEIQKWAIVSKPQVVVQVSSCPNLHENESIRERL
ncbi:MFS domain-containing protein [Aphelenchoides besseyi]|nr:MFS domain-containing protein [Aphelenchoides besseyi]